MGFYAISAITCRDCQNRKKWDTGFGSDDVPGFTWLAANRPRIKCGKCGGENVSSTDAIFSSVDMAYKDSKGNWEPWDEDLLWILPIEKPMGFRRDDATVPYGRRRETWTGFAGEDARKVFHEFEGLEERFGDGYFVFQECNERGGYLFAYGKTKKGVKKAVEECVERHKRDHLERTGEVWEVPEGYFREFDFLSDEERQYAALKEAHEASSVRWFNCRRIVCPVTHRDVMFDEPPDELKGKYLVVRDEHFIKGRKRGNVVAAFTPEEYAVLCDKELLDDDYCFWHCPPG
jgi:hypothetical protein